MTPFDASGAFVPAAGQDGIRRLAVRGAGVTVLSQSLGFAIQMIATIVLARLLAPADFGLIAMVTTFSLLVMNFGLNGFTEAVLQRDQMDRSLASNLFWINAGAGVLLTVAFAASGPLLARFYGDSRVIGVTAAMSATILLTSLSVQHLALLKRRMRFASLSLNDIIARSSAVAISIALASAGWGYWALVAGALAVPLFTSIGAWGMCRWLPGMPRRGVGTRPMIWFAFNTYGRFTMNYLTLNLDNLLIGARFGSAALGMYKKAYDLFILPANQLSAPLTSVSVAALSRVRSDPVQYERYFVRAFATLAFIGMGLGAALTLVGRDLILLLLGPRWDESGRLFAIFGPGIGMMLLYFTHGWIHLSLGRADRWLRWGTIELTTTAALFLAAIPWGPRGIAAAWVASYWILTIPALWYAGLPAGLRLGRALGAIWRYVLGSALAGTAVAAIVREIHFFDFEPGGVRPLIRILVTASLFTVVYLAAVILLHRGPAPISQLSGLLREMVLSKKSSRSFGTAPSVTSSASATLGRTAPETT